MDFALITVPAAPVRRKPQHRKEMVNQLLFGETVQILKTRGDLWIKVRSLHDNYEGWMTKSLITPIDEFTANNVSSYSTNSLLSEIIWDEKSMNIPFGASLPSFENGKGEINEISYTLNGSWYKRDEAAPSEELLKNLVMPWINAPYLWGGRTPLGVDCSGFVQVIYKLMGVDLTRDAWQQAQEGKTVKKFADILPGDLAFFDNKEDIVHTGILLGNEQIIHASGKVKIDKITKKAVYDAATGKKILSLRLVKRPA